jgi:hypothetical protein
MKIILGFADFLMVFVFCATAPNPRKARKRKLKYLIITSKI